MATLTIHDLSEETMTKLRLLAAKHGHSVEEEARRILDRTVNQEERKGLGTEIAQLFAEVGGVELLISPRSPARNPTVVADDEENSAGWPTTIS